MDKIELNQLFSVAIQREVESHEFYLQVAGRVENPNVKEVFNRLAQDELGHKELLERFKSDPTLVMKFNGTPLVDFKIAESSGLPRLSIDMKPADAIALAIKKEQQAMEFYLGLVRKAGDPEMKKIFESLSKMELGHKVKLENAFVEIGYPEVF
ncbi:MAG: ferritin family protein [Pseudomonadota bacterium]